MLVQWQYQRSSRLERCDRPRRDCLRAGLSPGQDTLSFKGDVTLPGSITLDAGEQLGQRVAHHQRVAAAFLGARHERLS